MPKVTAVKCSSAHDAELVKIARVAGKEWPGFVVVDGEAARGRLQLAVRLARAKRAGGRVEIVSFRPTQAALGVRGQHAIYYLALYDKRQRGPTPK